jgi:Gpi18-like mannosyltransferase
VLLYLLLAKRIKVRHLAALPLTYVLLLVPAALAGRPWSELATVYVRQYEWFSELSMEAANPWKIMGGLDLVTYHTGVVIGFTAAGLAAFTITLSALRLQATSRTILLLAAMSAALMPYLLPKMHDRYFFVADVATLMLAFAVPRVWVIAPLFQVGSLLSYMPYFGLSVHAPVYAVLPVTCAVGLLILEYARAQASTAVSLRKVVLDALPMLVRTPRVDERYKQHRPSLPTPS